MIRVSDVDRVLSLTVPIVVTLVGIVTDFRSTHPLNALSPNSIHCNSSKDESMMMMMMMMIMMIMMMVPIVVALVGIITDVRLEHLVGIE